MFLPRMLTFVKALDICERAPQGRRVKVSMTGDRGKNGETGKRRDGDGMRDRALGEDRSARNLTNAAAPR